MTKPVTKTKNKRLLLFLVLPLVSCSISSGVGILLGQLGNLLYKFMGQAAATLSILGFCGLFLVTFGLSFLSNALLKKWLISKNR